MPCSSFFCKQLWLKAKIGPVQRFLGFVSKHKEQVQAIFREWDTNCDGRLSVADMARVLAEIGISQAGPGSCSTTAMPTADEINFIFKIHFLWKKHQILKAKLTSKDVQIIYFRYIIFA